MYYYISFLRPPPLHAALSQPISVIPQVANDLRTEPYPDAVEIYYSWRPTSSSLSPSSPSKLTTWRQSSAYKEIIVPSPPGLRNGQSWRLSLTPGLRVSQRIDLSSQELGQTPLPVVSMPILFDSRHGKSGKQEQIERVYSLPGGSPEELPSFTITEQTSFDLDKVRSIWDGMVKKLIGSKPI